MTASTALATVSSARTGRWAIFIDARRGSRSGGVDTPSARMDPPSRGSAALKLKFPADASGTLEKFGVVALECPVEVASRCLGASASPTSLVDVTAGVELTTPVGIER